MKLDLRWIAAIAVLAIIPVSQSFAQEKKGGAEKAPEKAKAQKVSGDIGLLDTEKNYMIVVTKEGKLVTIDFNDKTKVTALQPSPAKMSDVGLGSSASVQYTKNGEKNHLTAIEYVVKKGGD